MQKKKERKLFTLFFRWKNEGKIGKKIMMPRHVDLRHWKECKLITTQDTKATTSTVKQKLKKKKSLF